MEKFRLTYKKSKDGTYEAEGLWQFEHPYWSLKGCRVRQKWRLTNGGPWPDGMWRSWEVKTENSAADKVYEDISKTEATVLLFGLDA